MSAAFITDIPYFNIWVALFVGFAILILFTFKKLKTNGLKNKKNRKKNKKSQSLNEKSGKMVETKEATRSKKQQQNRSRVSATDNYTHDWLKTSFKGHKGQVTSVDLSSNGRYLASASDDVIDADGRSEAGTSEAGTSTKPRTWRQHKNKLSRKKQSKKNRSNSSTTSSATSSTTGSTTSSCKSLPEMCKGVFTPKHEPVIKVKKMSLKVLSTFTDLDMDYATIIRHMKPYMMCPKTLEKYGFPVIKSGKVYIYKMAKFNINAKEFIPRNTFINEIDNLPPVDSNDSGKGSSRGTNTPSSSDTESLNGDFSSAEGFRRVCVRCKEPFYIGDNLQYITMDSCIYHHGKLHFNGSESYTCCNGGKYSPGCESGLKHVWNGYIDGVNGPYSDFHRTKDNQSEILNAYAIDCEMSYTAQGLDLTKITVVTVDGDVIYDTFVKPDNPIVEYNTRYSGITATDMEGENVKSLRRVQKDLLKFIKSNTILIGHGLENDLRALKLTHKNIIDTSALYPHYKGLPFRRSLRNLTNSYLGRDIQQSVEGHNSREDARACMELVLHKIKSDL